jgi:DNA-binding transcriptional LysR family regulator
VAELRSFNKTAAHLNTTQPAISARIRGLEDTFGRKLVLRHGRDVTLTAAGLEVLRYARPIIDLTERLEKLFEPEREMSGTVRIGAIDTIIHTWLGALFESLHTQHPEMNFEVRADTSYNLIQDLTNGEIDVALLMGPVEMDGVVSRELCAFPMAWVADPRRYRFPGPIDVCDLIEHPIISYPRGSKPYRMIEAYFTDEAGTRLHLNCSNSLSTIVRLACDGFGVAAIPPAIIQRELETGALAMIPVRQTFPPLVCHACYFSTASAAAAGLIAELAGAAAARFFDELPGHGGASEPAHPED